MNKRIVSLTTVAVASLFSFGATRAQAEGGPGVSFCSNSGRPVGYSGQNIFTNPGSYNNPGEVISWSVQNGTPLARPGQVVKLFCNPSG